MSVVVCFVGGVLWVLGGVGFVVGGLLLDDVVYLG